LATYKVANIVTWEYVMEEDDKGNFTKVKRNKYKNDPDQLDPATGEVLKKGGFKRPEFKEDLVFTPAIWNCGHKFYSGDKLGYVYEVGNIQHLPKGAPRNLRNTGGGGGLYIGGLHYIEGYRSSGSHVLTCFVNPVDILSFQSDGHAIRVDALMPNNVWDESIPLKGTYHSSEYGKTSTARVEALIKAAVGDGIDLATYTGDPDTEDYVDNSSED
jgi:hypothetical protein